MYAATFNSASVVYFSVLSGSRKLEYSASGSAVRASLAWNDPDFLSICSTSWAPHPCHWNALDTRIRDRHWPAPAKQNMRSLVAWSLAWNSIVSHLSAFFDCVVPSLCVGGSIYFLLMDSMRVRSWLRRRDE